MRRNELMRYSNEGWRSVLLVFVFLAAAGCRCATPPADEAADAGAAGEAQRQDDLARLPQAGGSLQNQLAAEAAGRPAETPTLESLTEALAKAGVTLGAPRQHYGRKMLAIYCATADSEDGLIVTICEYPTPEQAKRGEAEANVVASKTAGHQSKVRRKSVLHLVARSDTPAERVAKVLSAFDGL